MNLYGDKVSLRPITSADYPQIIRWNLQDYPATIEECEAWVRDSKSNRYQVRLGIILNDKIIGDIELDQITWRSGDAELRICIAVPNLVDQGYGTEAVQLMLNYAFEQLFLSRVYLRVYTDNTRAIKCYLKAGFKKEGRLMRNETNQPPQEIYLMSISKKEYERKRKRIEKVS